jgi:hypothetical protein
MKNFFITIFLFFFSVLSGTAQEYYRLSADFTVKIKNADGQKNLTKGKVYYDKNYKNLIYDISFP